MTASRVTPSFRFRTLGFPSGFDARTWSRLLRENHLDVDPEYAPKAGLISALSIYNSIAGALESRRFRAKILATEIQPPLFVIGHWRSGTTYLHQLLACDERFAFPTTYQCFHPNGFLLDEEEIAPIAQRFCPRSGAFDSLPLSLHSPQEDEFAVMYLSGLSGMTGQIFPGNRTRYDRLMTLRRATVGEREAWKRALVWFLKKLTLRYQKPLVLKSPAHTGRIRMLLSLFPDARFVHIHRDPYAVFPSMRQMTRQLQQILSVQRVAEPDDAWVFRTYSELYDAFFEDRPLIPDHHFHEVRFEDLERDPRGTVEQIYRSLDLPGFSAVEPRLLAHVASLGSYQKNRRAPLTPELRKQIATRWRRSFDAWDYAI